MTEPRWFKGEGTVENSQKVPITMSLSSMSLSCVCLTTRSIIGYDHPTA